MWLVHHPCAKEDHCEPQCANTQALREKIMKHGGVIDKNSVPEERVTEFIKTRLAIWDTDSSSRPSSASDVDAEFACFVCEQTPCDTTTAKQLLSNVLETETFTIKVLKGLRAKSSQVCYVEGKGAYTLTKPASSSAMTK